MNSPASPRIAAQISPADQPAGNRPCRRGLAPLAAVAFFSLTASSPAAFSLYQNFEGLSAGYDIAGNDPNENFQVGNSNASPTPSGAFTVIIDPTNGGNKLLESTAVSRAFTGSLGALSIANNTTATVFYRVYRLGLGNAPDVNWGIADDPSTPTGSVNAGGFYESQLNVSGAVGTGQNAEFSPRNGGTTINTDVVFTPGTWFGIFQVINSTTNQSQFYYLPEDGTTPTLLKSSGGTGLANFRNGTTNNNTLSNFLMLAGLPPSGAANQDTFYLDDIYVDISGSNLLAPVSISSVPEPTSAGVAGMAFCGVLIAARARAKRKRS